MPDYTVSFAGLHITILYDTADAFRFLSSLFGDIIGQPVEENEIIIRIAESDITGQYTLTSPGADVFTSSLGVHFAAVLFDVVIYNLLKRNASGIAFHAGAVAWKDNVILLPGQSGSGKSCMTACLVSFGCSYLTDELYFMPTQKSVANCSFTRPLCVKSDAVAPVKKLVSQEVLENAIADNNGYVIPHRLLNPNFRRIEKSPSLILIPKYKADSPLKIEKISSAQVTTQLMACDVNGRNLEGHGFGQVAQFARATPAYRISYNSFDGVEDAMQDLFTDLHWT